MIIAPPDKKDPTSFEVISVSSAELSELQELLIRTATMSQTGEKAGSFVTIDDRVVFIGGAGEGGGSGGAAGTGGLTEKEFANVGLWQDENIDPKGTPVYFREQDLPPVPAGMTRFFHGTELYNMQGIVDRGLLLGSTVQQKESLPLILGVVGAPSHFGHVNIVADLPSNKVHALGHGPAPWAEIYEELPRGTFSILVTNIPVGAHNIRRAIDLYKQYEALSGGEGVLSGKRREVGQKGGHFVTIEGHAVFIGGAGEGGGGAGAAGPTAEDAAVYVNDLLQDGLVGKITVDEAVTLSQEAYNLVPDNPPTPTVQPTGTYMDAAGAVEALNLPPETVESERALGRLEQRWILGADPETKREIRQTYEENPALKETRLYMLYARGSDNPTPEGYKEFIETPQTFWRGNQPVFDKTFAAFSTSRTVAEDFAQRGDGRLYSVTIRPRDVVGLALSGEGEVFIPRYTDDGREVVYGPAD